jgi:hypothetical protein
MWYTQKICKSCSKEIRAGKQCLECIRQRVELREDLEKRSMWLSKRKGYSYEYTRQS